MSKCQKCQQRWCRYRGTDGSLVYDCTVFLEEIPVNSDEKSLPTVEATKLSDVELLTEFKRRFKGSLFYNCNISELLYIIGEQKMNDFIEEGKGN